MPGLEVTRAQAPLGSIVWVTLAVLVVGMGFTYGGTLDLEGTLAGLAGFGLLCMVVAWLAAWSTDPFGAASRVTLLRSGLGCLVAGMLIAWSEGPSLSWTLAALIGAMLGLDALDGWLARRLDQSSSFGARFDMEIDALVLLILTMLVWRSGQVGPWVRAIGLMRYSFVACSWLWQALRAPLPSSGRRRAICAAQGVLLLVCLLPAATPALAHAMAAIALATLTASFAIDVRWLTQKHRRISDGRT